MIKYENRCCDCATGSYHCLGATCSLLNVPITYCDECGDEIAGDVYEVDDEELCEECLKERFKRND